MTDYLFNIDFPCQLMASGNTVQEAFKTLQSDWSRRVPALQQADINRVLLTHIPEGDLDITQELTGSTSVTPRDFAHYAERYQLNKDNPDFIEWYCNKLDNADARNLLIQIAINVDSTLLAKALNQ